MLGFSNRDILVNILHVSVGLISDLLQSENY